MAYKKHKQYRLPGYDYSLNGAYFITIVTKDRLPFFGEIKNNEMHLSLIGKFAERNFSDIEEKINHIQVDEWIIMPNHLYLIVTIENIHVGTRLKASSSETNKIIAPNELDGQTNRTCPEARSYSTIRPLQKQSISSFINHLKGKIKRWCNENNFNGFAWQAKFHDRIIRDEKEYERILYYIQNNILNWENDKEML